MSGKGPFTLVAKKGVLTFDGEVVESFGFDRADQSLRLHAAMLTAVEVGQGGRFSDPSVTFKARDVGYHVFATFTEEEAASRELAALIEAVRAAAPSLEQG